jgi:SNF2 family DNA or RNA helicase
LEVFKAEFRELREIDGLTVKSPSEDLPNVGFSPSAAPPALRVRGNFPDEIELELGVSTQTGFCAVPADADSVVHGNHWYPIDTAEVHRLLGWLQSKGLRPAEPVSLGGLISLRQAAGTHFELYDEAVAVPARIAAQSAQDVPGLKATPYPYQRDGIGFLRFVASQDLGCILADEMGLGKTLQVIGLFLGETRAGRGPSLVVTPATLLENWRRELEQFAPELTVLVHAGSLRSGVPSVFMQYNVTVTSYDTALRDEPLLSKVRWNVVALDEAQNIRNPQAQRTQAVKRLPRRVSVAVTGTPVENRLEDLWSLADFALPGLLGDISSFRGSFDDNVYDAERLAPVVAPIVLRRHVRDVADDLPPKIEVPQPIRMSAALADLYESVRTRSLREYGAAGGLVALTGLRQVCAHPSLVTSWPPDPAEDMPKYQRLLEIMQEVFEWGEKALVFCSWQGIADLFMQDMPMRWPRGFFSFIDGRLPVSQRQNIIDAFFDHPSCGALFLNPKAAGVGLNITAANHVIHYTPEWNPALTDQASRRAWRRKQIKPVTIHYLYFADSVEEVMMERGEFKRQLAQGAVTGHDGSVSAADILKALKVSPVAGMI